MDKSLLVCVYVPTTDAAGTDYHGGQGQIGTGYPVGPDLILTARHLLDPAGPDRRDIRYPIQVRWHYHREHREHRDADPDGWIAIRDDAVICPEAADLDAMLLRCPRPERALGWGIVSEEAPTDHTPWSSEGFPNAGDYQGLRHPCSFGGTCFSKAPAENYFELEAAAPPQAEDDWRGASGMPIFVGRRIVGVAQRVPRKFGAERLHATPCWKLRADPRFREALGVDDRQRRVAQARRELATLLAAHVGGLAALAAALDRESELVGLADAAAKANRLAAVVLEETDIRRAIEALRKAHRTLLAEAGPQASEPLVTAACLVVPALFDQGVILHAKGMQDVALVPLPAGTCTAAELIMAGVDGRPTWFRARVHEHDRPAGALSLPLHPEGGIGVDAGLALAEHLGRKLSPGREVLQGLRTAIDDYLLNIYANPEPTAPRRRADLIRLASQELAMLRKDMDQTLYMIFPLPDDPAERAPIEALVADLKRDYHAIAFLGLDPGVSQELADRELLGPFCRMLPLKPPAPGNPAS